MKINYKIYNTKFKTQKPDKQTFSTEAKTIKQLVINLLRSY